MFTDCSRSVRLFPRDLDPVPHAVQLLVVDWSAAVRWAGLRTGRRRREDLVATWNATHRREGADFSPRHFLFVHLHRLANEVDRGLHVSQLIGLGIQQT